MPRKLFNLSEIRNKISDEQTLFAALKMDPHGDHKLTEKLERAVNDGDSMAIRKILRQINSSYVRIDQSVGQAKNWPEN
jgi:hypothetical protein